ncbi:hypothetical protein GF336_03865 [Candidatus Woesearchaeota archaeon]|nr:hypothetical protein [Candidatus Woesearchaeota archaeon]
MNILIFGDTSDWNIRDFSFEKINPKILAKIKKADYVIYNLEGLIRKKNKSYNLALRSNTVKNIFLKSLLKITGKEQPIVSSDADIISLLRLNKNTIVTLANNHIKDLGYKGYKNTVDILDQNKIQYIGAGENNRKASEDVILDDHALINCNFVGSEKFGIKFRLYNATRKDYGASYQTYERLRLKIRGYHAKGKKVILIMHSGKEMPDNEKDMRIDLKKIRSLDADYTVLHHFHRYISTSYEKDNIFCIGNFIFHRPGKLKDSRNDCFIGISDKGCSKYFIDGVRGHMHGQA